MNIDEHILNDLESRVNTEYQKDMAAIRRVFKLIRRNKLVPEQTVKNRDLTRPLFPATHNQPNPPKGVTNGHQNGDGLEEKILSIIGKFPAHFTFAELLQALKVSYPDKTIDRKVVSAVIFKNKDNRIRVVQEGRGRRKAIYEKM